MKKTPFLFAVLVLSSLFSCKDATNEITEDLQNSTQEKTLSSIVSSEEYATMGSLEKEIVDMMNVSFNSLEAVSIHNPSNEDIYTATFFIDKDGKRGSMDYFALTILSKEETRTMRVEAGCTACGLSSGIKCAKEVLKAVDASKDGISVNIKKDGDCYTVSW